jgi:hypothetical protein
MTRRSTGPMPSWPATTGARLEFIAAGEGILAYGRSGWASHLAAALGHQACRRGHDVAFTTCSKLLAHLADGHADRSFETRVRKLAKTTVLICDDLTMREFTAAQADHLYELLTERIGRPGRSLILTSNRSPADWYRLFPNAVVGESILDRSSTPATTCCWKAKATGHGAAPASTGPAPPPRGRHDQKELPRSGRGTRRVKGMGPPPGLQGAYASRCARRPLRAALDPGDPCGPWRRKSGQAQPAPAKRAAHPASPAPRHQ